MPLDNLPRSLRFELYVCLSPCSLCSETLRSAVARHNDDDVTTGKSSDEVACGCHIIVGYSGKRSQPKPPMPALTPHWEAVSMLGSGSAAGIGVMRGGELKYMAVDSG